jgi:hypothetical protein
MTLRSMALNETMRDPTALITLVPGDFLRHPLHPEWGLGQVQSVTGSRITVNFEHCGKLLVDGAQVALTRVQLKDGD